MDHPVTAVYDANILYPAPLRDLFIRLAQVGLVRARWTETIHDEWIRNVLRNNPLITAERLVPKNKGDILLHRKISSRGECAMRRTLRRLGMSSATSIVQAKKVHDISRKGVSIIGLFCHGTDVFFDVFSR